MVANAKLHVTEELIAKRWYLSVKEAAEVSSISESEIYRAVYRMELRARKFKERRWLITRDDLDAWINAQSQMNVA